MRHRWGGPNNASKRTSNEGGLAVACIRCGMVREYVKGIPTYFINDTVHDRYAPKCEPKK